MSEITMVPVTQIDPHPHNPRRDLGDRYGITHSGEQYKGWLQIESGGPLATLAAIAGVPVVEGAEAAIWRKARAAAHPDRHGGRRELWDQVEAAARALGLEAG